MDYESIRATLAEFDDLRPVTIKSGLVNYHFDGSTQRRKVVVAELRHTGNGWVFLGPVPKEKGKGTWKDHYGKISEVAADRDALRRLVAAAMESLR